MLRHVAIILCLATTLSTTACVVDDASMPATEATEAALAEWPPYVGDEFLGCNSTMEDGEVCNYACAGLSKAECLRTGDCYWDL